MRCIIGTLPIVLRTSTSLATFTINDWSKSTCYALHQYLDRHMYFTIVLENHCCKCEEQSQCEAPAGAGMQSPRQSFLGFSTMSKLKSVDSKSQTHQISNPDTRVGLSFYFSKPWFLYLQSKGDNNYIVRLK